MKNLDIEKLERVNIYKTPDDFFEKMQSRVLEEVAPAKKAKIIDLRWVYSAAAAIALIFGFTFFINQRNTEQPVKEENVAQIEKTSTNISKVEDRVETDQYSATENLPVKVQKTDLINKNTTVSKNIASKEQKMKAIPKVTTSVQSSKNDIPMDQIVASFTSADLADLNKNTEQDVYLDLYN